MDATTPLPTGTVTFLFTDIEGSTRLWEQHPEAMREALARHNALLSKGIQRHGGLVVKSRGEGDSLFAVFSRASNALAAACSLQQALLAEPWPTDTPLRVRMALHTGQADLHEGDYFGPAVNRCARLREIAYGGQVLLSLAAAEMVRQMLPEGVSLRDLGEFRLRDLEQPERIFQLLHPVLPAEFPPLRTLDVRRSNLPRPLTRFIGRKREIAELREWLGKNDVPEAPRLVTLTGAGGCGKTRLALQVSTSLLRDYPDGVWLVELAALSDAAFIPPTLASVLGVREEPGHALTETLMDYLEPRSLLLCLDNCEHLIEACAGLAESLLQHCRKLCILATSREPLAIPGEAVYRVPSLAAPDPGQLVPCEELIAFEAVRLLVDRAVLSQPRFAITSQNAAAVAVICSRLDGIPLAIEMAAARLKTLRVEQLAARLDDRFRLLTGGSRTALPRQQTLRALIDWSYELLSERERTLLRRLAVFSGGWTLEAAETICAGQGLDERDALELLTQLVEKSLVLYQEEEGRYRLLETVRQYGGDLLLKTGEADALRARHLKYFVHLAEEADPRLAGPEREEWLRRLDAEHDNLRAALEWSLSSDPETGLRLAGALGQFWFFQSHNSEGRRWFERVLEQTRSQDATLARAHALRGAGKLAWDQGDLIPARALLEESVAIGREVGDLRAVALALPWLGVVVGNLTGDAAAQRSFAEESVALFRQMGDPWGLCLSLAFLAPVQTDDFAKDALLEEAITLSRRIGDRWALSIALLTRSGTALKRGDTAAARSLCEEALTLRRNVGHRYAIGNALGTYASILAAEGDLEGAVAAVEEALMHRREIGNRAGIAESLQRLARLKGSLGNWQAARSLHRERLMVLESIAPAADRNQAAIIGCLAGLAAATARWQPERAARLTGAVEALREALDAALGSLERSEHDDAVEAARTALGEVVFAAAWEAGRAMSLDEAVRVALEECEMRTAGGKDS